MHIHGRPLAHACALPMTQAHAHYRSSTLTLKPRHFSARREASTLYGQKRAQGEIPGATSGPFDSGLWFGICHAEWTKAEANSDSSRKPTKTHFASGDVGHGHVRLRATWPSAAASFRLGAEARRACATPGHTDRRLRSPLGARNFLYHLVKSGCSNSPKKEARRVPPSALDEHSSPPSYNTTRSYNAKPPPVSAAGTLPDVGTARMVCCRSPSISGMAAAPIRVQAWGGAVESVRKASQIREDRVAYICRSRLHFLSTSRKRLMLRLTSPIARRLPN
jgi:hypothetical protein